jgi:S-adenosylmethionine:tRNA ribosyltransferase-isomerase
MIYQWWKGRFEMLNLKTVYPANNDFFEQVLVSGQLTAGLRDLKIPPQLEAREPPEMRGLRRDEIRLMVSNYGTDLIQHTRFRDFPDFLAAGDVVIINTSGTLNAAVNGKRENGSWLEVHFSTHLPGDLWTVEMRKADGEGTVPFFEVTPGEILRLPGNATLRVLAPHQDGPQSRLWFARFASETPVDEYLGKFGFPIRYNYVSAAWSLEYYQTVYATEMGSAEMPSAGRGFTAEIITRLVAKGVQVAPLILHTGVSSQESHEPPYEEYYRVPEMTAKLVNLARESGHRVVGVGTTTVRALETVTDTEGVTHPGTGWTDLVITPNDHIRSVNSLLTGMHEPQATHLGMMEALTGRNHLELSYREALQEGYLWHEFGDLHLLVA